MWSLLQKLEQRAHELYNETMEGKFTDPNQDPAEILREMTAVSTTMDYNKPWDLSFLSLSHFPSDISRYEFVISTEIANPCKPC